jgi:hypothetical protein
LKVTPEACLHLSEPYSSIFNVVGGGSAKSDFPKVFLLSL